MSDKKKDYSKRIIRMADVEEGDPSLLPLLDEFILFWAENYPDKVRRPEYFYIWLEEKYGIKEEEKKEV